MPDGRGLVEISETSQRILNGTQDLSVWSEEELTRGVRRGKDGKFRNKPKVIPHAVHQELVKRRMSRAYDLLRESTYDAVKVLVEVAKDENADTAFRVKAAELVLDRALGTPARLCGRERSLGQLMAQAIVASVDPSGPDEDVACDPSYPNVCIPPPPPYLNCDDVPYSNIAVVGSDPHGFDGYDNDGVGCES